MSSPAGRKIRVLHVWNTGGAASIIAKYTDRLFPTEGNVITRKAADPLGLTTYGKAYGDGAAMFFLRALSMSRAADIVQVHSLDRLVPWLKRFYPSKPVVMYYLGTDIRGRWKEKESRWMRADVVAYTTSDLSEGAPASAIQVFCPVDTEAFPPGAGTRKPNSAVTIKYGMDEEAERLAEEMSLDLTSVERGASPTPRCRSCSRSSTTTWTLGAPRAALRPSSALGRPPWRPLPVGARRLTGPGKCTLGSLLRTDRRTWPPRGTISTGGF